ncbi:mycofactocin biosynthesis peptidyl-dipeptidase MftE [Nesterenkonia haasae]|uniref:mycofactocin biosynthesis peptidyl-dipeptidase MftE n=1 Tax=Nesterenkonia haasae TaxID=2587813 RepID=UPI001390FDCA|nr:mycofactocin biosynthesis peptidyl-dipeptidase MftE [Nesterenkonia haasae]NDK30209.1 mycofactocin biosynthesis peptidyl-dipeptidase MftE [Nesterenkonia haasae]
MQLSQWPWPEIREPVVLLPLGSTEQHGPHLPVDTDTRIAQAVAERLGQRLNAESENVLIAPAVTYGASGEHAGFQGTISIGHEALGALLVEYGRSALEWAAKLVIVNGHGGNVASLSHAVPRLRYEGREIGWLPCANGYGLPGPEEDAHAGRVETSLMLHIQPNLVHMAKAEPGVTEPLEKILPRLMAVGIKSVAANGVLGDPTGASAAEGEELLNSVAESVYRRYRAWNVAETGCLALPAT